MGAEVIEAMDDATELLSREALPTSVSSKLSEFDFDWPLVAYS